MVLRVLGYFRDFGNRVTVSKPQKANAGMPLWLLQSSGERMRMRAGRSSEIPE